MNYLTQDELNKVSSIFAIAPKEDVSEKYSFIPTFELVENFAKLGWYPSTANQVNSYKKDPKFGKHMVRFSNSAYSHLDLQPQIIIINSHNRTSKLLFALGIYRVVCSNGMIVKESGTLGSSFISRHMNLNLDNLKEIVNNLIAEYQKINEKINQYKQCVLTDIEKTNFAQKAIEMVWNKTTNKYEASELLKSRRIEDEANDLFTILNILQENILKGGISYTTEKNKVRHTRKIKSIDKDLNVNILLWGLMDNFLQNKTF